MTLKANRAASFIIVAAVYIVALLAGILTYLLLPMHFALRLLVADVLATTVTFLFSVILENASVYDPYWSVQPPVILTAFAIMRGLNPTRLLALAAVWLWGVRLTANWAYTFKGLTHQDWRYTLLMEKTGAFYPLINFLGIHLVPTLVVYACTLPAVFLFEADVQLNVGFVAFTALSVLAALMQGLADVQMHSFRKRGVGGFIEEGLWRFSRHPNYLGEILMWWGIGLAVLSVMPEKPYLLAGALLNTLLFTFVSLPMAEKRQGEKPGFAEYKNRTRLLLPIPKHPK